MKISATSTAGPHAHHSVAQAARELLQSRPDLANQPFGQIVSKLARGEEIPSPAGASSQSATPPADTQTATTPTDTQTATTPTDTQTATTPTNTQTTTTPTNTSTQAIDISA